MSVPYPELPDNCWPIDYDCCSGWSDLDPTIADRAEFLAVQTLRSLVGNMVGGCPTTFRPCSRGACEDIARAGGSWVNPVLWAGTWFNCGCSGPCIHNALNLPVPVGPITEVKIDGSPLAPTDYHLIDGHYLIRADGLPWPSEQDLTKPDTEIGTWSVTYVNSFAVDSLASYAAGVLACEYAKACSGQKCRLPENVTNVVRAGVAMQITPGSFPNGTTGIREVDAFIRAWNPYGLRTAPAVWSPKSKGMHTWR